MNIKKHYFKNLILIVSVLIFSNAPAEAVLGPGWHAITTENVSIQQTISESKAYNAKLKKLSQSPKTSKTARAASMQTMALMAATSGVYPAELEQLARALRHDPKIIYQYVHDKIDYVPYYGVSKGALATYLDQRGNDFDQALLMVTLLRASGYSASFVYGQMDIPGDKLANWFDVDQTVETVWLPLRASGVPIQDRYTDTSILFDRIWVKVNVDGINYVFDPAFKQYSYNTPIDLIAASGYNKTSLLSAVSGVSSGAEIGSNYSKNLNEANLKNKLIEYSHNLINVLRSSQYANKDISEILGDRKIIPLTSVTYQTTLPYVTGAVPIDWPEIPEDLYATVRIVHQGINKEFKSQEICGKRLTISYTPGENKPQLSLEGVLVATGNPTTAGLLYGMVIEVNHPFIYDDETQSDQISPYKLKSGGTYSIFSSFGGISDNTIVSRQQKLNRYIHDGLSQSSESLLGESLNVMGLTWVKDAELTTQLNSKITDILHHVHHTLGIMIQEDSYKIDIATVTAGIVSKHNNSVERRAQVYSFPLIVSAFEHGVLEQIMGTSNPGISTIKILKLANEQNNKVFFVNNANDFQSNVRPQLVNYAASKLDNFYNKLLTGQYTYVLPQNGALGLGDWSGEGYIERSIIGNTTTMGMFIEGALHGGNCAFRGNVQPSIVQKTIDFVYTNVSKIASIFTPDSKDPIDLVSGSFLFNKSDLSLGSAAPMGLNFSRAYNSSDNLNKGVLGYGWKHGYETSVNKNSNPSVGLGKGKAEDAAMMITAQLIAHDLMRSEDNITGWMTASLIQNWAVGELTDNTVVLTSGNQVNEFVKLPNGTYSSPVGSTTELVKNPDNTFTLKERFGGELRFNAANKIAQIKDVDNNLMNFTYAADKLTQVQDSYGRTLTFNQPNDLLTSVTDSASPQRTVSFGYDANNNLTTFTDPEGKLWKYGYDSLHRMTTLTNPLNTITATNTYNDLNQVITQEVPRQNVLKVPYNFYFNGWRNMEVDPFGNSTTYHIDDKGRTIGVENALGHKSSIGFDGRNHQVKAIDPRGNVTEFVYDNKDNVTSIKNALLKESKNRYDAQLRLYETEDPLLNITKFEYDIEHHLKKTIDAELNEFKLDYYPNGKTQTSTDARLTPTVFTYDSLGSPLTTKTSTHPVISYTYDSIGRLTTLVDQVGATTNFTYDRRGLLTFKTDPLSKTSSFVYDDAGRLFRTTDRKNVVINYEYTKSDQIEHVRYPDLTHIDYNYDLHDRLTSMVDLIGTTIYQYDNANRLSLITNPYNKNIGYIYDAAGNVTKIIYPDNKEVNYTYDVLNRLETVTNWLTQTATYVYDAAGRLDYQINFNGTVVDYGYDKAGRLKTLVNKTALTGGSIISSYDYTLDGNGNRTNIIQQEPLQLNIPTENTGFVYNNPQRNRLQSAGSLNFSYDDEGQTFTKNSENYTFDFDHRLKTLSGSSNISYKYDGSGNRLEANRNGVITRYVYDASGNLLAETDSTNTITRYYIHGLGLLATAKPTGEIYTYHFDGNANTMALTNASKLVVNKYAYTPFGRIIDQLEDGIPQPFKYVGQYGIMAEPNGLYYMRARYYDPQVHRFISEDPSGFGGGDVNLYAYVANNPILLVDPLGLSAEDRSFRNNLIDAASAALIIGDIAAFGPTGEGIGPALGLQGLKAGVRTEAKDLAEQIVMKDAIAGGGKILDIKLKDPRYVIDWVKKQVVQETFDGRNIVIHYFENIKTGIREGFKFMNKYEL